MLETCHVVKNTTAQSYVHLACMALITAEVFCTIARDLKIHLGMSVRGGLIVPAVCVFAIRQLVTWQEDGIESVTFDTRMQDCNHYVTLVPLHYTVATSHGITAI